MSNERHEWECEDCEEIIAFQHPEKPQEDPDSEQNESKKCPDCGGNMWFQEA